MSSGTCHILKAYRFCWLQYSVEHTCKAYSSVSTRPRQYLPAASSADSDLHRPRLQAHKLRTASLIQSFATMAAARFDLLGSMRARYWGSRDSTTPADSNASGGKTERGADFQLRGVTILAETFPASQQTASSGTLQSGQDTSHAADVAPASQVSHSHTGLATGRVLGLTSYGRSLQHDVAAPAIPTARSDLALSADAVAERDVPGGADRGELNTSMAVTALQMADRMGSSSAAAAPCMTGTPLEAGSASVMGKPLALGTSW